MLKATLLLIILALSIQKNLREIATSIAHALILRLRGAAEKLVTSCVTFTFSTIMMTRSWLQKLP